MNIVPIATIITPFSEKFAIPRQSHIVQEAHGTIVFKGDFCRPESLHGIEAHSHYWLTWGFHTHESKKKSLTVRPPRLGGNKKIGVFATRSPFRPNNLGLSVVKLEHVDYEACSLVFSGVDMLCGSPIYDIKPYIPYADSRPESTSQWAHEAPEKTFTVTIMPDVLLILEQYEAVTHRKLRGLIEALLTYDTRPAYKKNCLDDKIYATQLYDVDIAWRITGSAVTVISATFQTKQRSYDDEQNTI